MSLLQSFSAGKLLLAFFVCWKIQESIGLVQYSPTSTIAKGTTGVASGATRFQLFAATNSEESDSGGDESNDEEPQDEEITSTVRYQDDGMTDRFKYKVHALMGDYDPTEGTIDDEGQDGNIMKALITFPTQHVFDVVGKVGDDSSSSTNYADQVRSIVFETTGDENIQCDIIPRGTKFVKVRCEATVESTTMINNIYEELGEMESTVMKF